MALLLIGTGFGRTGTNSLKLAFERLGFGPCHHMFEVRNHPEELHFWQAATRGRMPDWDAAFANYSACVDWPSAFFWREITAHFPDAKVLLSVRPEEDWYRSMKATIYKNLVNPVLPPPGFDRDRRLLVQELILQQQFGGRLDDKAHTLAVYRDHIAAIQDAIAPDRLLTYNVAEGWAPLCAFLEVGVPDEPFPLTNTTKEFQQRSAKRESGR
jgi:hypothetical protein